MGKLNRTEKKSVRIELIEISKSEVQREQIMMMIQREESMG